MLAFVVLSLYLFICGTVLNQSLVSYEVADVIALYDADRPSRKDQFTLYSHRVNVFSERFL